jgi:hypothetical protein
VTALVVAPLDLVARAVNAHGGAEAETFTFFLIDIFLLAFASELRTTKGQLWASIWFKNESAVWYEPPQELIN